MEHLRNLYRDAYLIHGDSPKSVHWPKGRQDMRFVALTKNIQQEKGFSILDFGCGLAHLYDFLNTKYRDVKYTGADILPEFITADRKKYPNAEFLLIDDAVEIKGKYDYIVASGVFNILFNADVKKHKEKVFEAITSLFNFSNVFLSVNFMTDAVDFMQEGAYHQNVAELCTFVSANLSKRIVIDQSYMPYEYTITIFKDQTIIRPDNIYHNA